MVMALFLCCINALRIDTALGMTGAGSTLAVFTMPEKCNMFAFNPIYECFLYCIPSCHWTSLPATGRHVKDLQEAAKSLLQRSADRHQITENRNNSISAVFSFHGARWKERRLAKEKIKIIFKVGIKCYKFQQIMLIFKSKTLNRYTLYILRVKLSVRVPFFQWILSIYRHTNLVPSTYLALPIWHWGAAAFSTTAEW